MMSKPLPPIVFDEDQHGNDFPRRGAAPASSPARRLVSRIAEALQVSEAMLYDLPNARPPAWSAAPSGLPDAEGAALVQAFRRIGDPEMRHRLLRLAQAAANKA